MQDQSANEHLKPHHVVIVGGGFGGLNAARALGDARGILVTIIDRSNHHLFQPLLYQVAMAALSPADIAYPIRSIMAKFSNIDVVLGQVVGVKFQDRVVVTDKREYAYDSLILACGSQQYYFGHDEWESHAPGLKTLAQATEIRRRVLLAFENAAIEGHPQVRDKLLTFVIIGGGPTGVELAGAIGEMSRYSMPREFRNLDISKTKVILLEAGPRILSTYDPSLSERAKKDLEGLGVEVITNTMVTKIDEEGVCAGQMCIPSATVIWAAGVVPSRLNKNLELELDARGRVKVDSYCRTLSRKEVFVVGDQASFQGVSGILPGLAPVASQQGAYVGQYLKNRYSKRRKEDTAKAFRYLDKGQMATIGRKRAVLEAFGFKATGFFAWLAWLFVHIYFLVGFKNKFFVMIQWALSYLSFKRGARLIVEKEWRTVQEKK